MNLDWIRSFAAFADCLNFTRAAQALNLSQPALHVQVQKLAEALEVPLYRREGRKLFLTAEGEKVRRFAGEIQDRMEDFTRELKQGQEGSVVTLMAGEGAFLYLLDEAIRLYSSSEGLLQMRSGDGEACLEGVRQGDAHLGVAALDVLPEDLETHLLTSVPMMLVMPENHPLAGEARITPDHLKGQALVAPPPDRPHRQMIERVLEQPVVAVEASGWELCLRFVSYGAGVAVVNSCCSVPPGLISRPMDGFPSVRYCLFHRRNPPLQGNRLKLRQLLESHANAWKLNDGL